MRAHAARAIPHTLEAEEEGARGISTTPCAGSVWAELRYNREAKLIDGCERGAGVGRPHRRGAAPAGESHVQGGGAGRRRNVGGARR